MFTKYMYIYIYTHKFICVLPALAFLVGYIVLVCFSLVKSCYSMLYHHFIVGYSYSVYPYIHRERAMGP